MFMRKMTAIWLTAVMILGLSVPVMAAEYAPYTTKANYTEIVFDAATTEAKTVSIVKKNGTAETKDITLITLQEGSKIEINEVPGNDPFVNVDVYENDGASYKEVYVFTLIDCATDFLEKGKV
ncbi:MAG: hypothetical protein Q4C06_06295, partial [Bacillota bacterium]|nr:hypothetical protein [Bacillota bacterium]